ncbi:hypothetical protein STENM36S_04368 [Streptomyces tendae]
MTLTAPARPQERPRRRPRVSTALTYVSLVVASAVVLLPLLVIFLTSLKSYGEISDGQGALALPDDWLNFSNYATAFTDGHLLQAFGNTAFILLFSITGTVIIGSMTAYAIDRFDFRFKKLVMALFLIATLVPAVTTQVATFQVVNSFGLFNTRWAPVLLYMGTDIVAIYIFLQFIRGIPRSLDEAARLDGANSFTIYRKIIFPLLKPAARPWSSSRASRRTTTSTSPSSTCPPRTSGTCRRPCSGSRGPSARTGRTSPPGPSSS